MYDYTGTDERLATLAAGLAGHGVAVRTATTDADDPAAPADLAVLHEGGDVLGTVDLDRLLPAGGIEAAFEGGGGLNPDALPADAGGVTVSPETTHGRMVAVSRRFERLAMTHADGWLRTGFQELSRLADSPRTRSLYRRLADAGLDVAVCGYPDAELDEPAFEVIADEDGRFRAYWFLLFDGGDREHKAALVAEARDPGYEAFWTVDPATVDELVGLARDRYPALA